MNLIKFNNTVPSLLDEFFNDDWSFFNDFSPIKGTTAQADVIETDDAFDVELMLPGFDKDSIEMKIEDNALILNAERKERDVKYNTRQSYFGKVSKSYTLPNYVDKEKIKAAFDNGVLKITVPKLEKKSTTKLIQIE